MTKKKATKTQDQLLMEGLSDVARGCKKIKASLLALSIGDFLSPRGISVPETEAENADSSAEEAERDTQFEELLRKEGVFSLLSKEGIVQQNGESAREMLHRVNQNLSKKQKAMAVPTPEVWKPTVTAADFLQHKGFHWGNATITNLLTVVLADNVRADRFKNQWMKTGDGWQKVGRGQYTFLVTYCQDLLEECDAIVRCTDLEAFRATYKMPNFHPNKWRRATRDNIFHTEFTIDHLNEYCREVHATLPPLRGGGAKSVKFETVKCV